MNSISSGQSSADPGRLYASALSSLEEIKERIVTNRSFEMRSAIDVIEKMIESHERIQSLYPLTTKETNEEDHRISHQVNVAIYALKLGFGLGYSREKLLELGICSLLHDAGMFRIPDKLTFKRGPLTGYERDVIKTHPEIGRDILKTFSENYPSLPAVAFEHHEREGGQGYPRGLQGKNVHEFSRIVAFVDSYEAMTHHRPHREALMESFSAKELIGQKNALFAPFVIKSFFKEISLYPPGSYVILNNKALAEVVANDQNHPLRPDVKILFNGEGNKVFDEVIIKLSHNPLFFIVDGLARKEISQKSPW